MTYSDNPQPAPPSPSAGGSHIVVWIAVGIVALLIFVFLAGGFFWFFALGRTHVVSYGPSVMPASVTKAAKGVTMTDALVVGRRYRLSIDTPILLDEGKKPAVDAADLTAALEAEGAKYQTISAGRELVILFETKRDDVSWYYVEVFRYRSATVSVKGWTNATELQGVKFIRTEPKPEPAPAAP